MITFRYLLLYALLASTTNNFVWFALTYWAYLSTKSVVATGVVGGVYLVATAASSMKLGSLVDRYRKKTVLMGSGIATLALFTLGLAWFDAVPASMFTSISSVALWGFVSLLLLGVVAGNVIGIAIPTLVTVLVPKNGRDKANGLFGTVMGVSFAITSVASGFALSRGGMHWVLTIAIVSTLISLIVLYLIPVGERRVIHADSSPEYTGGILNTLTMVKTIPGLLALIFFTTFNNFVGGVFMALMDAYGLSLVTVEVWGLLWGFLSFGFILGGLLISKFGLGKRPLDTLFTVNTIIWLTCIFFPIQPSIILLTLGSLVWMTLFPFIEATEQTIIQNVVPENRQGRVFGFAHSIEQSASPLTAFFIGPITQYLFIPLMTDGIGAYYIGSWFGKGTGRGIALVFILAGIIGLIVSLIARRSPAYRELAKNTEKR